MVVRGRYRLGMGIALGVGLTSAVALAAAQPQNILPGPAPAASPNPVPTTAPTVAPDTTAPKIVPQVPLDEPVVNWSAADAQSLLGVIEGIDADGLIPADYQPEKLRSVIAAGDPAALDAQASKSFAWLAEDMRDGRTRFDARLQWFVVDSDVDAIRPRP